ncbi:MAG: type II toxin-antitoxin system VapC family toxin [Planctomycetes bacterium]|nr:type II toxin-antitoxin system VapC family toxin [Planctomycetota bacterium]
MGRQMKKMLVYVDASVVGGCDDVEFAEDSLALWRLFAQGQYVMVLSEHTLRELAGAPERVRRRPEEVPQRHRLLLADNDEAYTLAEAYLEHGIVGPGSRSDALHVALAVVSECDVLVSWNFKHMVNLGRIRLFNAVSMEKGYRPIEIRSPKEMLLDEEEI